MGRKKIENLSDQELRDKIRSQSRQLKAAVSGSDKYYQLLAYKQKLVKELFSRNQFKT